MTDNSSTTLGPRLGLIDGSVEANSRRFHVVLDSDAVVQLDDLVVVEQTLPNGASVSHFGIVVETTRIIEGARYASDTSHIDANVMPGETARLVEVQILRADPEMWMAPDPGMVVRRADGAAGGGAPRCRRTLPVRVFPPEKVVWLADGFG